MFNGYNETPLISYEFNQDRGDKKQENASKWSYGHEAGVQPAQIHPGSRQSEFWSGKANFVGLSNVVKCNCTGCYPSSENQSYQGDTTCHRPWLPRTFPVPLNGSSEPYKLPAYQWDSGALSQGSCYPETNAPFVQENGGKHAFYRHYQESRLPEPNQPGVITSLKNAEFGKKQKEEVSVQNGVRQPVLCNPIYNLAKRADGRNYCDPNDKYSNAASFSVDQHIPRLPVVEPYIKAVPSNLSQSRVPSTGYRSVKENASQSYLEPGYGGDSRKMCTEQDIGGDKRSENYGSVPLPSGAHVDYSNFGRDLPEAEPQKLFFDNGRHSEYYSKKNFQNVINRNNQPLDGRKDCVISQIGQMSEQQYNVARSKYQEAGKPSCETFYPKNFDKTRLENHIPENSPCFQRNEDKNENMNVHARLTRSALIFNDPRFADRTQNSFPYQNNPAYRNYVRPEYPYQGYNAQHRYEYPPGFQRNDCSQYRGTPQQMQTCDQFIPQQGNGFVYDPQSQQTPNETAQFYGGKNMSPILMDSLSSESKKPTYLEPIRSEAINKNGTNKISPLRLLRKKKFINVPHEPSPAASTLDAAPGLDVRKFWSTWAEEEEENVTPTQMVVLDCQNIDPEQAKLLHLYDNDPVQLESGGVVVKGSGCSKEPAEESVRLEEIAVPEEVLTVGPKNNTPTNCEEQQQNETSHIGANCSAPCSEPESKPANAEKVPATTSPCKTKSTKSGSGNRGMKKTGVMDKWTEKKFDFLKRSEESKAAEILRHEQEKKKIFETRLSLQQSLKKVERSQEKSTSGKHEDENTAESVSSPFDENSQSSSPYGGGSGDVSNLPTSEYRRNKFLDYSDRKVIVNGKDKNDKILAEGESILEAKVGEELDADEIKKEKIKLESELSTDELFPVLDGKLKDKPSCEMEDILQKMSEINFQNNEVKLENGTRDVVENKLRSPGKKVRKKKSDHQPENDQRADKLTLETVKFSIQKSHDLKISFKVLNNSKKCSDEEPGSKDTEAQGNPVEDSQNSTELITLRYKSIQRDGDRISESKKSRRRFRRKKNTLDGKTPVLKIRKSRYMSQLESDPLANYEDDDYDKDCDAPLKKPYSDEYSTSDDFHVHETVDSAKIKLTFKRHKTNFEKQYKINGNNVGNLSEPEPTCDEFENDARAAKRRCKKRSKRAKGDEIFAEAGVESFRSPEVKYDVDSDAEISSKEHEMVSDTKSCFQFESHGVDEEAKNSATSQDSCTEEENHFSESATTEMPSDTRLALATLGDELYDNEELALEGCNDDSTPSEDRAKSEAVEDTHENDQHQVELITSDLINRDETNGFSLLGSSDENSKDSTYGEAASLEENQEKGGNIEREGIREISLDFISSTNSREIEMNEEESEKTEETDTPREENNVDPSEENVGLEMAREIIHSEIQGSSHRSESENEKSHGEGGNSNVPENLCEWKETPAGCSDAEEVRNIHLDDLDCPTDPLDDAPASPIPLFSCEDEDELQNCVISKDCGKAVYDEDSNEGLPDAENLEAGSVENAIMPERKNENKNSRQSMEEDCIGLELPPNSCDLENAVEDVVKNDSGFGSPPVRVMVSRYADAANPGDATAADEPNTSDNNFEKESNTQREEPKETTHSPLANNSADDSENPDVEMPTEEEQNSCGISRTEDCDKFENKNPDTPQKDSYEIECAADDTSPPKKGFCEEVSKITLEDPRLSPRPEHPGGELNGNEGKDSLPEKADCCSFSFAEKTDPAVASNSSSDDVNDTGNDSESEKDGTTAKNVADNIYVTSPRNGENLAPSSNTLSEEPPGNERDLTELSSSSHSVKPCEGDDESDVFLGIAKSQNDDDHLRESVSTDLPLPPEVELEDGEIVDSSSDELEPRSPEKKQTPNKMQAPVMNEANKKQVVFVERKIERRNSAETKISGIPTGEYRISTCSKIKFSKSKSCPREMQFTGGERSESGAQVAVEEIPLPLGPPPRCSCFDLEKRIGLTRAESSPAEAKEKPKESISSKPMQVKGLELPTCESSFGMNDLQNGGNPSDADSSPQLGIFQRSSKIKFSLSKRSKFSKIVLKNPMEESCESSVRPKARKEAEKEEVSPDNETNEKDTPTTDCPVFEQSVTPAECQSEQVPNANVANGTTEEPTNDGGEELKEEKKGFEHPVELLGEDLEENIEVIGAVSDYMRDEFYEFEDIPTSEDLTNGDDLEIEKVNDDKFRNIMQNCLDNAKKFLNVGNLKLFSCSVDDLLELDCQAPDSALEEQEAQPNHISRDVLLASCEDTNDDLGLSENMQPSDLSMDFVPSLCSDVCPEILPVDNWPYLEEEVPSSPTKSKQDEADLIPSLEAAYSNNALNSADTHLQFYTKNGIDRRKRVIGESCFKRFRRRSLISDGEAIRMCSKIGVQRRSTVDSFGGVASEKEIRDIKSELLRWTKGKDDTEKQSLKCRLSLEKLRSKHGINFKFKSERMKRMSEDSVQHENGVRKKNGKSLDYKSPSWQPKVMLFRISKTEMRKLQRKSKSQKRPESATLADSAKRETSSELEDQDVPANKKPKSDGDVEKVYLKLEHEGSKVDLAIQNEERLVGLSGLEAIKGSLSMTASTDERKRKKSRFRNLYTKRKSDPDASKEEGVSAQKFPPADPTLVDAEAALAEMFRDCDRVSNPQVKSTKQVINVRSGEKPKKKSTETYSSANQTHSPGKSEVKSEKSAEETRSRKEHQRQHRQREKSTKKDASHGDRRREKGEHYRHKDRHKDSVKHSRHESSRQLERSKHSGRSAGGHSEDAKQQTRDRSRSSSGGEARYKTQSEISPQEPWCCEVCGFNDAEERVTHIKSHPFHCQSCHLAFKTESYFVSHLTKKHKNIRNQHHCLLCELSFDTEEQYQGHLGTREHTHLESVEKNTINTLFTLLTGAPCPVLGLVEMKPEWLPNQAGTVHFYHQATPLSLALQYLKMHHDLTSFSTISSSAHPN